MSWLFLLSALAGVYLMFLAGYRLYLSGKRLSQEALRTGALLSEISSFERVDPTPASAVTSAEFQHTLEARRRLVRERIRRRELRERRLVNRIREIEVDKRWS